LSIAYKNLEIETNQIQHLKTYFINELKANFKGILFNGNSENEINSSYIILNARFPKDFSMLLFNLDLKGIAVSGGSACQSGSNNGSHVLNELLNDEEALKTSVRFSFSKLNTIEEIDAVIKVLIGLIN